MNDLEPKKLTRGAPPAAPIIGGTDPLAGAVADAWPKAQAYWSRFLLLGAPVYQPACGSVAQIDLCTRQVALDLDLIRKHDLCDCMEALLAHEVGHHVRYPGTLAVHARMRLMELGLLPLKNYTLTNLFTDLMINDALRPAYEEQLARIYRSFAGGSNWGTDPAFIFYLAVYEERWRRPPGSLMSEEVEESFAKAYPGYRAEAQMLGENLFHLGPNVYAQFLYFVSVVSRYVLLKGDGEPVSADPYACGCGEPSPDDWADALAPDGREREAIRRARGEGWISEEMADRMHDRDATARRIASIPGTDDTDATRVPEVMAAYYRQQAERYLLRPPPQLRFGEATTPTTLDEWDAGDSVRDIDWVATLLQRGAALGAITPLKRLRVAESEGWEVPMWQPRIEVYLDVSGSMPDPRSTRNAMTLAAQILVTGAIRAGGWARVTLYSSSPVVYREWCRSETELSKFLMHYIGAGTDFPFALLRESVSECGYDQPVRVVITDTDFDHNYKEHAGNPGIFAEAATRSPHFILMLHAPDGPWTQPYKAAGARVISVTEMDDYPAMAVALSTALFGENDVSLTERLFGRPTGVKLDLVAVRAKLGDAVRRVGDADPELTRARLADGCRDAAMTPPLPEEFDAAVAGLEGESWRRLAVLVGVLELGAVRAALPQLPAGRSAEELVAAFAGLARATPLLTIEVLEQSELRVEELARRLVATLGAAVAGESLDESKKALHRLDYARLITEAEQARQSATERAERLRVLQEEQEARRTRRGKH